MMTRGLYPERAPRKIDYELMRREHPRLKGQLTRAINSGDPTKVVAAVDDAVAVWEKVGCWPDDWSRWKRALEDAWEQFIRSDIEGGPTHDATAASFRSVAQHFDF